ncbi:BTAD domain-containing putative transcriptional regulator [Microbispora bryophytorum]|uniref:Response regulator n=1 Tax=Microbispora bryophytorum subsp. camponoti TaxID=1677852 RepID=A0ABR8KUZ1_9ACTN|nr:BTAD domain-containing putative transcriptional regulator [Microbispora camponoti]MBD3142589.1 response regulator [Microbispora camponoti]
MVTFRALGPFGAISNGETLDLGGQRQQAVLARLLVAGGRAVPVSVLIDELWPGEPPAQALSTIQGYVSRLRRALEPNRAPREEAGVLVSAPPGYALRAVVEDVDSWHFEHLVKSDHEGPAVTLERMETALALWRGPALAGFQELAWAQTETTRLDGLRLLAVERRADAALRLGRTGPVIPDLEAHASAHPLREEAWRLLALALYRAGRQGDALGALRRARETLRDELGLDLGPALQRLEQDILVQSEHLDVPDPAAPDRAAGGPSGPGGPGGAALRVLIADDQALVRTGLKVILDSEPGLELVGEAENGEQAIALVQSARPDVVLMDIQMPRLDGLAAARRILAAEAPPRVIMMTTFGTDENLYAALRAGVSGFVLKTSAPEQLIAAVRAAVAGDALLDPAVTTHLIAAFAGRRDPAAPEGLSDSDIDLIKLVARGFTNRQIAMTLAVPEQEVADEVTALLRGLGLVDRAQLVVLAYERGLVSPGSPDTRPLSSL